MLDEEFEKRKERARLLRNSVGMITDSDMESNSSVTFDNDFQEKLNKAKELRNSIGMITGQDSEEKDNLLNIQNSLKKTGDIQDSINNIKSEVNEAERVEIESPEVYINNDNDNDNYEAKERVNVILNNNKPTNLLTNEEKQQKAQQQEQAKQYAEETNSDKNWFSQIGKTIENLYLGMISNAKSGAKYITQTQHTPQQEAQLLQGNKNIIGMEYLNQLNNNNPITNKAEKQIDINNNLSGLQNGNNFAWAKERQTLSDAGILNKADENKINKEIENSKDAYGNIELNPIQRDLSKSIVEDQNKIASNVNKIDNPIMKKIAELAPSTGNTLVGAGLSMINPYLGMTYFMISASGMYEAEGRARGMSKEEARAYGTIMGYAEGATEMVEISNLLKAGQHLRKGAIKEAMKHYGLDMADNAVQEAIIDPIDEIAAQVTSGKTKHDYSKSSGYNEIIKDMVQDGIDGALSSLLMNGIDIGINSSINLYKKIQNGDTITKQDIQDTYNDIQNNPNIDVNQHIKDSMNYQKQKILDNNNQVYSVIDLDHNGNVVGITQAIGSPIEIESKNKNLNIKPVVVYTDGYYNIIDADSGLKLDTTLYSSKDEAIDNFKNIINKADNATINNVNEQVTKAKLALVEKMQDVREKIIANPEEAQAQNRISFVDNNKLYSNEETKNILNQFNIESNLNNRPYLGQEINNIINNSLVQTNQNKELGNFDTNTSNNTTEDIKKESGLNNEPQQSKFYENKNNYAVSNVEDIKKAFNKKKTYTLDEVYETMQDVLEDTYNNTLNDDMFIDIEEKNGKLEVVLYDARENDDIVDTMPEINRIEISKNKDGKYTTQSINEAIEKAATIPNESSPIQGQIDIEGNEVIDSNKQQKFKNVNNDLLQNIDNVLEKTIDRNRNIKVLENTPEVFQNVGMRNLPVLMTQDHIRTTVLSKEEAEKRGINTKNKNFHALGKETLLKVLDNIDNPIYIYQWQDNKNNKYGKDDYIIITQFKDSNNDRIIVPVLANKKDNIYITVNKVKSAYGKIGLEGYLKKNIKEGNLKLVYNKKELDKSSGGIQYSSERKSNSSITNSISQKNKSVKNNENTINNKPMQNKEKNTNIQDFGKKIGGARKDLSTPRGTKTNKEVIHDYTVEKTDNGYTVNFKGKVLNDGFKTQKEAEQYILDFKKSIKDNRAFVHEVINKDGENRYMIYLRNPRTLKSQYAGKTFLNKADAESYAMALSMYLKENGKNLFRPQIQKVERINEYSKNATKATGDDILNNFGFKGGEFGNWVKQNERQQFLNYAQDAFTDLATALDVTPDSLGQKGAMSIAFGARGQGLIGASAHFEPAKKVINMTRLKGAGSLAHEYGHSIDNYLSREGGYDVDGMVTRNSRNPKLSDNLKNAIKDVEDAMRYNISTNQEEIDKKNAIYEKNRVENLEYNLRYIDKVFRGEAKNIRRIKGKYEDVPIKVTEKQKSDYKKIRETLINGNLKGDVDYKLNGQTLKTEKTYPEPIGTLQKMYKEVVGRKLDDDTVYSLYRQGKQARQVTEVKSESGYSKSALELDRATGRSSAYFSRIDEMWARAFESYISDKLKAKGIKDTYLVHSVNNNEYALFNPFPAGEERKNINKAFDNLIQTMKDEGLFTSSGTLQNIDEDTGIRYMKKKSANEKKTVQGLENYDYEELKSSIKEDIKHILEDNYLSDVDIVNIDLHGSRLRKTANENSDLDVVLQYDGDIREDDLFNILNENPLEIEGIKVDINPIQENLKDYMERSNKYDREILSNNNSNISTDNHGRTLSKQQEEYFKNSKLRNTQNELEVVYHTTPNVFTEFDDSKLGDNTLYDNTAFGHFITTNKKFSERFGDIDNKGLESHTMEMYANVKNPITHPYNAHYKYNENELDNIVRNYLKAIDEEENIKQLEEYAEENNSSLYDTYMSFDMEGGMFDYAKDEREILQKKGYDAVEFVEGLESNLIEGSKSNKPVSSYAVFNSNQLKNVDNTNPTSNNDIRLAKNTNTDEGLRNAERGESYIEQEIKKIEQTGNWDNSIPVTKLTDIRKTIEDYLGLGIKKGHFRQDAYAIYKSKNDVIRTKEYKDMDSILHETGHAIDLGNRLKIDKEAISNELLTAIDKLGGYEGETRTVKLEEGFAEVIREYSIVPEQAKAEYPQTVAVLEGLRKTDKKFNDFVTKVQQQSYNYIHQNPRNRTLSNVSIGEQTDKQKITKNFIKQEVMRNIYDRDYIVKSAVNELAKASGKTANQIKASENAYYLTRLASGKTDKVISMLSDGYIDDNGNKMMPGLSGIGEILGDNSNRWNDLRAYLVAQRDLEYKAKTLKTGIRTMDSKAVVDQFKNDKQIQQASKLVYDTLNGVMQYAVNNGLISQETADKLKQSNVFYVPMQRVLENRGNQVGRRGAVADIIKKRTGSELDVKDVLENIIANSSNIIQQVDNNNVLRALYKEGQATGLTGTIYDVIDTPMTKIGTVQLSTWENELNKQGVNTADLDLDKTIDLFAPNNKVDSKNLITSFINENGKRVYLQFNDELLFNSLMNMDKKFMSQVLKINSKMNMPLRYGATMANLGFAIPNMISDTAQASIYSTAGFIPLVDNAIGVLDIMASKNKTVRNFLNSVAPEYAKRINKIYSLYQQSGATSSTRMSQYRESTQNTMADVYGTKSKTLGIKEKYKPLKRLLDILTYIPEISEQSTRFRVFEKNYEQYKKKGTAETDARILAALESRDATQDFGRTGNVTREINQLIPFSAARVGSIYTFAEKIKANPKQVGMRIAVLTAIAMAIKAIGYDDDEIEELNQRKKDDNFVLRAGDNIVTIKKPQGILRSFINLAEYIQDLTTGHIEEGKEGEKLGNWLNNAIMDNAPADEVTGFVPNAVAPIIENAINKDFYYNTDIVKSYDLDLPDSEQYYDYNSQLAIWLGKIFNYSPAKIDNLISGYFGGLGTSVTGVMDYALGKAGVIPEKPEMGAEQNTIGKRFIVNVNTNSSSIDEIYNRKTELTKKQNGGIITSAEEEELKTIKSAISNMSDLNKQIKEIKKDLTISGEEKAEKIKILQQEKTDTARKALGKTLIHSENEAKIQRTQFYPNDTLKKNGYSLTLNSSQKKEYEQIANDYYSKYEKQGLYNKEKLEEIKSNAKEYAKNQMFKKYKANLVKTK